MSFICAALLVGVSLCLMPVSITGIQSWCKDYFEGFSLENDYNPNAPPSSDFALKDEQTLMKIDEVRKAFEKYEFVYEYIK